jgi:hypothetical protein
VLKKKLFPEEVEGVKTVPITKLGKENSMGVWKFKPISLINVGGNVLGKLLINRIMHYVYSKNFLKNNQFGFTPRKSAIDAALAVKEYLAEGIREGHIPILVSLNVRGPFDAA